MIHGLHCLVLDVFMFERLIDYAGPHIRDAAYAANSKAEVICSNTFWYRAHNLNRAKPFS